MRVSHLVFAGILLIVVALLVLHPWLTGVVQEHCDIMLPNGHQPCDGAPRLVFHHVPIALAIGGVGIAALLSGLIMFGKRH